MAFRRPMREASWVACAALAIPLAFASCGGSPEGGAGPASSAAAGTAGMNADTSSASKGGAAAGDSGFSGGCAAPCTGDMTCCDGACVDLRSDAAHCGSCSAACEASATEMCVAGQCGAVDWALWPMPNGKDDTSDGAPNPIIYSDNLDGTVTDQVTNLMWQQRIPVTGGPSEDGNLTWAEATAFCATLAAAGHTDWRLPSQIELASLVDYSYLGEGHPPINSTFFPDTPSDAFWSSTKSAQSETAAWTVYMDVGFTYAYDMTSVGRVRCVR